MTPLNENDEITFGPEVVEPKDGFVFKVISVVKIESRPATPYYENEISKEGIMPSVFITKPDVPTSLVFTFK
jgi:hypothetical protein